MSEIAFQALQTKLSKYGLFDEFHDMIVAKTNDPFTCDTFKKSIETFIENGHPDAILALEYQLLHAEKSETEKAYATENHPNWKQARQDHFSEYLDNLANPLDEEGFPHKTSGFIKSVTKAKDDPQTTARLNELVIYALKNPKDSVQMSWDEQSVNNYLKDYARFEASIHESGLQDRFDSAGIAHMAMKTHNVSQVTDQDIDDFVAEGRLANPGEDLVEGLTGFAARVTFNTNKMKKENPSVTFDPFKDAAPLKFKRDRDLSNSSPEPF